MNKKNLKTKAREIESQAKRLKQEGKLSEAAETIKKSSGDLAEH